MFKIFDSENTNLILTDKGVEIISTFGNLIMKAGEVNATNDSRTPPTDD